MLKKYFFIIILTVFVLNGVFAESEKGFSWGTGLYFTNDFGGGIKWNVVEDEIICKTPYYIGIGIFGFFDIKYAEASLGFFRSNGTFKIKSESDLVQSDNLIISYMGIDIGILGKYPIEANNHLSLFPLLGIDYRMIFFAKGEARDSTDGINPGDFSALWIKLGAGMNFVFNEKFYFKGNALYGLRLPNGFETRKTFKMYDSTNNMIEYDIKDKIPGHGLTVKLAIGFLL